MLPQFFKDLVIKNLNKSLPTVKSWLYESIKEFIINKEHKTCADYIKLLAELQEIIDTNPLFMKSELGDSFEFFKVIRIIEAGGKNYSNVDKMLSEIFNKESDDFYNNAVAKPWFNKMEAKKEGIIKPNPNTHINAVNKCYEDLKDLIRNALCNMCPAPHTNSAELNYNIGKIYENIAQLRNLACKNLTPV